MKTSRIHATATSRLPWRSTFSMLSPTATRDADLAASLLRRVFRRLPFSVVAAPIGTVPSCGGRQRGAACRCAFLAGVSKSAGGQRADSGQRSTALAEAYFRSKLGHRGRFFAALRLKDHLEALRLPWASS